MLIKCIVVVKSNHSVEVTVAGHKVIGVAPSRELAKVQAAELALNKLVYKGVQQTRSNLLRSFPYNCCMLSMFKQGHE